MEEGMDLEKKDDEQYPLPIPPQAQNNDNDITEENRSPEILSGIPMTENAQNDMRSSGKLIGVIVGIVIFLILLIIVGVVGFFFFRGGVMERVTDDLPRENMYEGELKNDSGEGSVACRDAVRDGYMGDPISYSELDDMQQELNEILMAEGSDITLTLEEACLFIAITNDAVNSMEAQQQGGTEVIMKNALAYMTTYSISQSTLQKISSVSEIVLQHTRHDATDAYVKSVIVSTVPGMILCMDDNGYLTEPKEGQEMCRGNSAYGVWPVLNDNKGAKWGGCKMSVERVGGMIEHFAYCATMADGTIVTCRETGCDFGDEDGEKNDSVDDVVQKNETYADEKLTRDVMQGIFAKLTLSGCDLYESHTTQIIADMMYNDADERTWTEQWTVYGCGKTYPIDIVFTETRGQGTVWTIE